MNSPLNFKAANVAQLVERLADACADDEADSLATALADETADLEQICERALRRAAEAKAYAKANGELKQIYGERESRFERQEEAIRQAVAHALQEAGLPGFKTAHMTVTLRQGKPPLIIDGDPDEGDYENGLATRKVTYAWDKDAIRQTLSEASEPFTFARIGQAAPVLTVRTR